MLAKDWLNLLKTTGDICPIRLGMTREEVRGHLGAPTDTGGTSRKHKTPSVWKYGEVEFHFTYEEQLALIYQENELGVPVLIIRGV